MHSQEDISMLLLVFQVFAVSYSRLKMHICLGEIMNLMANFNLINGDIETLLQLECKTLTERF